MKCPKCAGELLAVDVALPHGELELAQCRGCSGIWFDSPKLDLYLNAHIHALEHYDLNPDLRRILDEKPAHCPRCRELMHKRTAPNHDAVLIDGCPACKGIWLDSDELEKLVEKGVGPLAWTRMALSRLLHGDGAII